MARSPVTGSPDCAEAETLRAFGVRVRQARQWAGMSQMTAAFATGLHFTYISDVEQGRRNVTLLTLMRLADGLGVSPASLTGGSERTSGDTPAY